MLELLRGKTRILCTHRVEFVEQADLVVLMENGSIARTGGARSLRALFLLTASAFVFMAVKQARRQKSSLWWRPHPKGGRSTAWRSTVSGL